MNKLRFAPCDYGARRQTDPRSPRGPNERLSPKRNYVYSMMLPPPMLGTNKSGRYRSETTSLHSIALVALVAYPNESTCLTTIPTDHRPMRNRPGPRDRWQGRLLHKAGTCDRQVLNRYFSRNVLTYPSRRSQAQVTSAAIVPRQYLSETLR